MGRKKKWLTLIVAAIVLAGIAAYVVAGIVFSRRIEDALAKIAEQGHPVTLAQLAPAPIPPERNGATELTRAIGMLPFFDRVEGVERAGLFDDDIRWLNDNLRQRAAWLDPDDTPKARNVFAKLEPAFAEARRGLAKEAFHFDLAYGDGVGMRLPQLSGLLELARLFALRGAWALHEGDIDAAISDAAGILRLAEAVESDPLLISLLMGIAIDQIGATLAQDIASGAVLTPAQARRLSEALMRRVDDGRMARALIAERAFGLDAHEKLRRGEFDFDDLDGREPSGVWTILAPLLGPWVKGNEAVYLDVMARTIGWAGLPLNEFQERADADGIDGSIPRWAVLPQQFAPAMIRAAHISARGQAIVRAGASALALAANIKEGRDDIAENFAPDEPAMIDPYTGRRLKVRVDGEAVAVYSVGPNSIDDGGAPYDGAPESDRRTTAWHFPQSPREGLADDLPFTVRLAEKAGTD